MRLPMTEIELEKLNVYRTFVKKRKKAHLCGRASLSHSCVSNSRMKRMTFSLNPSMWVQRP